MGEKWAAFWSGSLTPTVGNPEADLGNANLFFLMGTVLSKSVGGTLTWALSSGKVGKTIQILGQGFTGTTNVSFNGVSATFTVVSDTYLTAVVPAGATTGFVTVTTPSGTLTSNKEFRVSP